MTRGLVIGKFLPIHIGHIALIRFAAQQCNELIVSMSYTPQDPINPQLRFSWIQEIFKNEPAIKPAMVEDNFDDESLAWSERTKLWASFIKKRFPTVHRIFSSEEYGDFFAVNLDAEHIAFDTARNKFPVSATSIRQHPFDYWDFIPEVVRPFFVKKVCFYGPESTGKSTMAKHFAAMYKTEFVPEVARELITSNVFSADDIIRIGHAQTERVLQKVKTANKVLFCDTDLITTQIYSRHYLGIIPPVLYALERKIVYDRYFLFDIDTPWIADGLRDLGNRREEMFEVFKNELQRRKQDYVLVRGSYEEREAIINTAIQLFFQ
jgi:HTH-type transcriptional repressor of NAD biosynthesis genes